jgi:hypothetical protein
MNCRAIFAPGEMFFSVALYPPCASSAYKSIFRSKCGLRDISHGSELSWLMDDCNSRDVQISRKHRIYNGPWVAMHCAVLRCIAQHCAALHCIGMQCAVVIERRSVGGRSVSTSLQLQHIRRERLAKTLPSLRRGTCASDCESARRMSSYHHAYPQLFLSNTQSCPGGSRCSHSN